MKNDLVVQTHALTKRFGQFTALDSLTISLERGHILGFIGPNGAGKTTTIRILVGLSRPTSGRASVAGADCVRDAKRIKRLVGYMPDSFGSYDNMRVHEYLDFFGAAFKLRRKKRRARIDEVLDIAGAAYMRDLYVESLSHGMKQRIGIARTLVHDPEVLILDEPANGLDPAARIEMRHILLRLAQMGKTLIVTSHILPELSRICDTVAIITHGELRAFGTLEQIMSRVAQRRTMEVQFLSTEHIQQAAELIRKALSDEAKVTVSEHEAVIRFDTSRSEKQMAQLLSGLTSRKLGVAQFREVVQDLEDAFLTVTRGPNTPSGKP